MFKISGIVKVLNDTVQITDKFSKREFVITDNSSMYPQHIMFQATQDKCALLDSVQINDQIEVSFNLRGREWTSPQGEVKYFNTLEAWRIEKMGQGMPQGGPSDMDLAPSPIESSTNDSSDDSDDLPF